MSKTKIKTIAAVICLLSAGILPEAGSARAAALSEYRPCAVELYTKDGKLAGITLRRFRSGGRDYYLLVDPVSLRTGLAPVGKFRIIRKTWKEIRARHGRLPYFAALAFAEGNSRRVQNAGVARIPGKRIEYYLSADLCPSGLPLDRSLFTSLIEEYGNHSVRIPITIAVSGLWIAKHQKDLSWLMGLEKKGSLAITWANHSFNHRYNRKAPWWKNFLLDGKTDLDAEILKTERTMLESGIVPSVFFRFPGLVSDRKIFAGVTGRGLIPLGSDAWLGKLQWPVPGSIMLVHANGQEPVGIKRFLWLLQNKKKDIMARQWVLGDIRDGLGCAGK